MSVLRLALVEVPDCCFLWRTARCWWAPGQRDELAQAAGSRRQTERAAASLILSWRVPAVAGHRYAGACRPSSSWLTGARAWLFLSCIALLQACLPPGGLILYHVFHSTDRTHACVRQGNYRAGKQAADQEIGQEMAASCIEITHYWRHTWVQVAVQGGTQPSRKGWFAAP
jgi:hypothetical protein